MICVWTHTGKERERIKAWEQKICFLHLRECMIPTENISLTHEHYDLCVLPRPRSQPCWYLHVEFRTNLGNKMAPTERLVPPPKLAHSSHTSCGYQIRQHAHASIFSLSTDQQLIDACMCCWVLWIQTADSRKTLEHRFELGL